MNISIYRIIQECLTNVAKYAQASKVIIDLSIADNWEYLKLEITDDGIGFDSHQHSYGLGLIGMRERTASLQGEFTLNTVPDRGTQLLFSFPLNVFDKPTVEGNHA